MTEPVGGPAAAPVGDAAAAPVAAGPRSEGGGGWLVACDLDQTLIFSRRSFRLPAGVPEPPLSTAEHIDGEPAAFLTVAAAERLAALDRLATLVPVTTRTLAQYRRVDLGVRPRYAIAANGGHLLVGGQPDQDWAAEVAGRLAATSAPLAEAAAIAEELAAGGWTRLTRVADDLFVYLVAHHRDGIPDLGPASARLAALGYTVSVQGRKVYLVPTGLTKGAALAEVVRRAGTSHLAAAGDSLLDAPMLAGADVAIRPAHGELHDRGWTLPGLRVTAAAGLLAGEELAASLVDLVSPAPAAATPWPAAGAGAARARLA